VRLDVNLANKLAMIIMLFVELKKTTLFAANMETVEKGNYALPRESIFVLNMHQTELHQYMSQCIETLG
jgi:hypothetical protein